MASYRLREGTEHDWTIAIRRLAERSRGTLPEHLRQRTTPQQVYNETEATARAILKSGRWHHLIVAEDEAGTNVGHLWVGEARDSFTGIKRGYIYDIFVEPAHRQRGLGRQLMLEAERLCHQRGDHEMGLSVEVNNIAARRLYESLGYQTEYLVMSKPLVDGERH